MRKKGIDVLELPVEKLLTLRETEWRKNLSRLSDKKLDLLATALASRGSGPLADGPPTQEEQRLADVLGERALRNRGCSAAIESGQLEAVAERLKRESSVLIAPIAKFAQLDAVELSNSDVRKHLKRWEGQLELIRSTYPDTRSIKDYLDRAAIEANQSILAENIEILKRDLIRREQILTEAAHDSDHRPKISKHHPDVAKRRAIVARNPSKNAADMCKEFDLEGVPLPSKCEDKQKWTQAYKDSSCRSRIDTMISKDRSSGRKT